MTLNLPGTAISLAGGVVWTLLAWKSSKKFLAEESVGLARTLGLVQEFLAWRHPGPSRLLRASLAPFPPVVLLIPALLFPVMRLVAEMMGALSTQSAAPLRLFYTVPVLSGLVLGPLLGRGVDRLSRAGTPPLDARGALVLPMLLAGLLATAVGMALPALLESIVPSLHFVGNEPTLARRVERVAFGWATFSLAVVVTARSRGLGSLVGGLVGAYVSLWVAQMVAGIFAQIPSFGMGNMVRNEIRRLLPTTVLTGTYLVIVGQVWRQSLRLFRAPNLRQTTPSVSGDDPKVAADGS